MIGPLAGIVAMIPMLLVFCVGLVIVVARRPVVRIGHNNHARLVAIHRHTVRWRGLGLAAGLLAALGCAMLAGTALGRFVGLAPAALGAGLIIGTIVGERTARAPLGTTREAGLGERRIGDLLRGQSLWPMVASTGLLVAILAMGTVLGSPDDLGRAGRALARTCQLVSDGVPTTAGERRGPWPGSFYTLPLGGAFIVLGVLAFVALKSIAARRAAGSESEDLDRLTRSWSTGNVLRASTVSALLIAGPLATVMGATLSAMDCRASTDTFLQWMALAAGVVATGLGLALLASLFMAPRLVVDDLPGALPPPAGAGVRVR